MKTLKPLLIFPPALWLLYSCFIPSGTIPDDPRSFSPPTDNILTVSESLPYFDVYLEELKNVHLDYILEEEGPVTVFMPNVNAFNKFFAENNISKFTELPEESRREILLYHIIPGKFRAADIPTAYYPTHTLEITTGNPIDIYVNTSILFRLNNDACMDEPDLPAVNGIIHSIASVKNPQDVVGQLSSNPDFSLFLSLIGRQDLEINYLEYLKGTGPFTVFVPTEEAIRSFLTSGPGWNSLNDIPAEFLDELLRHHLIAGENFLVKWVDVKDSLTAIDGSILTFEVSDTLKTVNDEGGHLADIVYSDIQAYNGVIQLIDEVLFPE
jgi:uncharacterized surface protein with fasciclin (FAS1) repeats